MTAGGSRKGTQLKIAAIILITLAVVSGANAGIGKKLSSMTTVPVYCEATDEAMSKALAPYGFPGYTLGLSVPNTAIFLSWRECRPLRKTLAGWRDSDVQAAAIYGLGREIGHVIQGDPIHGQPGHNDPGASCLALTRWETVASDLGIKSAKKRARLRKLVENAAGGDRCGPGADSRILAWTYHVLFTAYPGRPVRL